MIRAGKLDLKIYPDKALYKPSEVVSVEDESINSLILAMMKIMEASGGVGLSAPQLGINKRIVTFKIGLDEGYLINPKIIWKSEETQVLQEGCLSFPGVMIMVKRHAEVKIKYVDIEGEEKEMHAEGLHSQMLQHEIDHLDGKVFVQYTSSVKRDVIRRKMLKMKSQIKRMKKSNEKVAKNFTIKQAQSLADIPVELGEVSGKDTGLYDFTDSE